MVGRPNLQYVTLRDALNEALKEETRISGHTRFGWIHRPSDSDIEPSISIDLSPTACASMQTLLKRANISFSVETPQAVPTIANQFTRISISIPELSDAQSDGRLRQFLSMMGNERHRLRQQQEGDYKTTDNREAHTQPALSAPEPATDDPQKSTLVDFMERFGGRWELMAGNETFIKGTHAEPSTVKGRFKSSKEACQTATKLRDAGFNVEVNGTGGLSCIQINYRQAQQSTNNASVNYPSKIPDRPVGKPKEKAISTAATAPSDKQSQGHAQPEPAELVNLWFNRNWPLENGIHVNTQMRLTAATRFCQTLAQHGVEATMEPKYHFMNRDRPYYEVKMAPEELEKIRSSAATLNDIASTLAAFGEQSNADYLNRLFNGGAWLYCNKEEKYYPTEAIPHNGQLADIMRQAFGERLLMPGEGEHRSIHIPESVLLEMYENPKLEAEIRTISQNDSALTRLARRGSSIGKDGASQSR